MNMMSNIKLLICLTLLTMNKDRTNIVNNIKK